MPFIIDRINHPIASQIPSNLWRIDFEGEYDWDESLVQGKSLNEIQKEDFPSKKRQGLILLLVVYKESPALELIQSANEVLGFSYDDIFIVSTAMGKKDILEILAEKAPAMIEGCRYEAFHEASVKGHLDILKWLAEQAPGKLQAMIAADYYYAFRMASACGHLDILKWLAEQAPGKLQAMIAADCYHAFRMASAYGHLDILKWLAEQAPGKLQAMIATQDYDAFRIASANGHLGILKWLAKQAPEMLQAMIAADHYGAFRWACLNGHLDTLKWLTEKAPDRLQAMIAAKRYEAFREASAKGHLDTLNWLLEDPCCLAYAESHIREYSRVTTPFITGKLQSLHEKAENHKDHTTPFDISEDRAKHAFYILRNLIRQNDSALHDEIRFLLTIPAVKALAHREVTPRQSNELLRLALTEQNEGAAEILLNLPEVRRLAEQNNYYQEEARGNLDLRALAADRERLPPPPAISWASQGGFFSRDVSAPTKARDDKSKHVSEPPT